MKIPVKVIPNDRAGRSWMDSASDREFADEDESKREARDPAGADDRARDREPDRETVSAPDAKPNPDAAGANSADDVDWKDRYIRLLADFENHKRHVQAERDRLAAIGKEAVLDQVFPLVDHLEQAIKAGKKDGEQGGLLAGIELAYRELIKVLEQNGVERVPTVGAPFDPRVHEAVAVHPRQGAAEGEVLEEVRPGFIRNGRLLRPALVVVAP